MDAVLHSHLPVAPWMAEATRRLPGVQPLDDPDGWCVTDEAYAGQMALRDRLIAERAREVHALRPEGRPGAGEVLERVLARLPLLRGFAVDGNAIRRPDGVTAPVDRDAPLLTLGRLVQQDICLLEKRKTEHVLTGAILCFPASWSLAEKIGRPLSDIHAPVAPYDAQMARRVQRLFDALRPGRALWRANALLYDDPALFQPRRAAARRETPDASARYLRSERQTILRLPRSGAVLFAIHTYVVPRTALTAEQAAGLGAVAPPRAAE